ncbi:hypothetical protein, variant [Verruconis gallopava]|uniref:Carbohydrate-binding module family 19 domain-containing protein n=1 Tax=Verruconis gallopava TaxID=253628 RepID=A0A0D2AKN0_9PEZI|nr:uncharacterized protein PV09_08738 [Verruconis gallopava]XP_016209429.1 hypothetical protein, variant [Verruconis gallopava]KIV99558.1 hypothetical protein PV09_08738 [Verruconis gallopava]KIV99559.1 hypothetical protein, variant [Verruconis gallopava]
MVQSQFPCKSDEVSFTATSNTTWMGGQTQPLHLLSAATHGGGSCFIAMTYETPGSSGFSDLANWYNIYTIPGSCPATTAGNLDTATTTDGYPSGVQCTTSGDSGTDCVHSYDIPMPDELKDGNAVFAWVWLSKVTTETYMNCAPITISGAKASGDFTSLPSLTGLSFTGLSGGGVPGGSSSGSSSTGGTTAGSGSAASGSTTTTPSAVASSTSTASSVVNSAAVASASASSGSQPASGSTAAAVSGACSPDGSITCTSTSFSMCSNGQWVSMGSIGGLTCSNGQLNKRYQLFRA